METDSEAERIAAFKDWIVAKGGHFHPQIAFKAGHSGYSVVTREDLPPDTSVVSVPFSLAITPEVSRDALSSLFGADNSSDSITCWSERQLICSYLCMHWIVDPSSYPSVLSHRPYLDTLPSPEKLRTPLHFTPPELEAFRGTNLYGATRDRQRDWEVEWQQCRQVVAGVNQEWGNAFTWERYLTASTYISSRAFPSTLLSPNPSLVQTSQSHPVLLPGIDALNHARSEPVSWVISGASPGTGSEATISLVLHNSHEAGSELFNNYGPKPNAELILGYGFSLPHNPDDTIVLKIGGAPSSGDSQSQTQATSQQKWEVGRNAKGAEPVWEAVLAAVSETDSQDSAGSTVEDELYAADMLAEMAESLYSRLPSERHESGDIRPEIALMLEHYLEGQCDILQSLIEFARNKERAAVEAAREQGLQIIDEDEDGET